MTIPEFEKKYNVKVASLPANELTIEEVVDNNGQKLRGIVMQDPSQPYRRITLESITGYELGRSLGVPSEMLRANQHSDFLTQLQQQQYQSKSWRIPLSPDDVQGVVERAQAKLGSTALSVGQENEDAPPLGVGNAEEEEDEEHDEEPQLVNKVGLNAAALLLEQTKEQTPVNKKGKKGRGRGRGKGAGEGMKRPGSGPTAPYKRLKPCQSHARIDDGASVVSLAQSKVSGGTRYSNGKRVTPESALENASNYIKDMDLSQVMAGVSLRGLYYNATRNRSVMERMELTNTSEYIQLNAHLDLFEKCEKAASLSKVAAASRQALLEECCAAVEDLPLAFQMQLLKLTVNDMPLEDVKEIDLWVQRVKPLPPNGGCWAQWQNPKLENIVMDDDVELAKYFQELVVNASLYRVLGRGQVGEK
eukprot:6481344-Amphidinium_carterae.1